ncbi:MAG: Uma2 family endonuclease [Bacteroidota bacterium]
MLELKNLSTHPDYEKYPSSDGELMAETTRHFEKIETIYANLEILTEGKDIFVAADLLWYPVKGRVDICKAPDVMVAIGRPKGHRDTYLQWLEANTPPQVVFEIFSRTNRRRVNKENLLEFYTRHGVQEYYIYDPVRNTFIVYQRRRDEFTCLERLQKWTSPLLGIRFEWSEKTFEIYHPNGERFLKPTEIAANYERAKIEVKEAKKDARFAMLEALAEAKKTVAAEQKAEAAVQEADAAKARQKLLEAKLLELGLDPNAL